MPTTPPKPLTFKYILGNIEHKQNKQNHHRTRSYREVQINLHNAKIPYQKQESSQSLKSKGQPREQLDARCTSDEALRVLQWYSTYIITKCKSHSRRLITLLTEEFDSVSSSLIRIHHFVLIEGQHQLITHKATQLNRGLCCFIPFLKANWNRKLSKNCSKNVRFREHRLVLYSTTHMPHRARQTLCEREQPPLKLPSKRKMALKYKLNALTS